MLKSLIVLIVQVNYAIIELPMATVVVLVNNQNSEYKALLGIFWETNKHQNLTRFGHHYARYLFHNKRSIKLVTHSSVKD